MAVAAMDLLAANPVRFWGHFNRPRAGLRFADLPATYLPFSLATMGIRS